MSSEAGTPENPWTLKTPPLSSTFQAWFDTVQGVDVVVVRVGSTVLHYDRRCLDDLQAMLAERKDWVELGSADEQKEREARHGRGVGPLPDNPVGGWYGLKKGLRGRFAMYIPPLMEQLGLAEVEHNARNNRMRAL